MKGVCLKLKVRRVPRQSTYLWLANNFLGLDFTDVGEPHEQFVCQRFAVQLHHQGLIGVLLWEQACDVQLLVLCLPKNTQFITHHLELDVKLWNLLSSKFVQSNTRLSTMQDACPDGNRYIIYRVYTGLSGLPQNITHELSKICCATCTVVASKSWHCDLQQKLHKCSLFYFKPLKKKKKNIVRAI